MWSCNLQIRQGRRPHEHEHEDLCTILPPPSSVVFSMFVAVFVVCAYQIRDHSIYCLNITSRIWIHNKFVRFLWSDKSQMIVIFYMNSGKLLCMTNITNVTQKYWIRTKLKIYCLTHCSLTRLKVIYYWSFWSKMLITSF